MKKKVYVLKETLGDLERSPLRSRLFVVLDSVHQHGLRAELVKLGVIENYVVIWEKNGIEYLYPVELLCRIVSCGESAVAEITISGDKISVNGITLTKNELATEVLRTLCADTSSSVELRSKLLNPLIGAIED